MNWRAKVSKIGLMVGAVGLIAATPTNAVDWSVENVKVIRVEPSYVPDQVVFHIDRAAGNCPAGAQLRYFPQNATELGRATNAQAVLSTVLTAMATDKTINIFGLNENCQVQFVHINKT